MAPYRSPDSPPDAAAVNGPIDFERFRPRSVLLNTLPMFGLLGIAVFMLNWLLRTDLTEHRASVLLVLLVAALAMLFWAVRFLRNAVIIARENLEGVRALQHGRWQDASQIFDGLLDRARGLPRMHAVIAMNRAVTMLNAHQPEDALRIFRGLEAHGSLPRKRSPSRGLFFRNMAATLAILDQLDEAESYLRRAHEATPPSARPDLLLVDMLVAARRERFADVIARTASTDALHGMQSRMTRILRAFSLERAGEAQQAEIDMLLAGARPCAPGELDYYAVKWPALRSYLVTHGFSNAS